MRLVDNRVFFAHDSGNDLLAEARVRNAECSRLLDAWQRFDREIDLSRRDLFAAAVDDLLDAPRDMNVTLRVDATEVARAKPRARELGRGELRIIEVTAKDQRPANDDLAASVGRTQLA